MDEIYVLDSNLEKDIVIDQYVSHIWTERYSGFGDFEIYAAMNKDLYDLLAEDTFLQIRDSDNLMVVEARNIKANAETGDQLLVKGRSLESILNRRIIWAQTILSGSLQTQVQTLLNQNLISAIDTSRRISLFEMALSTDPAILALTLDFQERGKNLYDAIKDICDKEKLGFKVHLTSAKKFCFELYFGLDRSADQTDRPAVIFSTKFDNMINSDYYFNKAPLKTTALVLGTGDDPDRKSTTASISGGAGTGLARREMCLNAGSSVSEKDENGVPILEADYLAQLQQKGSEELAKNVSENVFEATVDPNVSFVYGVDYFLGDIVQKEDEYGNKKKSRITEIIRSYTVDGVTMIPTFENIED